MITLDTSGLLAVMNRLDPDHARTRTALLNDDGPYLIPCGILAEVTYMIEARLGLRVLDLFLADLDSRAYALDCGDGDVPRIKELVKRYADLSLGFADASVVACAERSGGRVLTLDRRDFGPVSGEGRITLFP
ncbi:MAG: PIN domain-containing protein [Chloroflexi bacterium]|nr:PIN domain-containing protein [Chloroflexota bacterium]